MSLQYNNLFSTLNSKSNKDFLSWNQNSFSVVIVAENRNRPLLSHQWLLLMQTERILHWNRLRWAHIEFGIWWMPVQASYIFSITAAWCGGMCYGNVIVSTDQLVVMDTRTHFVTSEHVISATEILYKCIVISLAKTVHTWFETIDRK